MNSRPQKKLGRIGVIGDIHCEDRLLEAVLEFLQTSQVELICAVGDIVDGPGDANRTIQLLVANHVLTVRGNHERWLFGGEVRDLPDSTSRSDLNEASWEFLSLLPLSRKLETSAGSVLLCHGLAEDDMAGVWPDDHALAIHSNTRLWQLVNSRKYQIIINGHTHRRMVRSFEHLTIINAGTLLRKHNPCFCIADFEAASVRFYDVGFDGKAVEAEVFQI